MIFQIALVEFVWGTVSLISSLSLSLSSSLSSSPPSTASSHGWALPPPPPPPFFLHRYPMNGQCCLPAVAHATQCTGTPVVWQINPSWFSRILCSVKFDTSTDIYMHPLAIILSLKTGTMGKTTRKIRKKGKKAG